LPKLGYGHNHKYPLKQNSQSMLIFIQHKMGISSFISEQTKRMTWKCIMSGSSIWVG